MEANHLLWLAFLLGEKKMNKDKIIVIGHILSVVALIACLFVWYFSDSLKTIDSNSSFL